MSDWNSAQYLKFKKERTQPSVDLANRIHIENPKRIIDIGCGPGNSTAVLKSRFPDSYVLGVDFSPNMIERAKSDYPELDFMLFDATSDFEKLDGKFDVVFSNACIQWVPDHKRLLCNMMAILNAGGVMAVQVPNQAKMPIHKIIKKVTSSEKWKSCFEKGREFYNLTEEEYFNLLSSISSDFSMWQTTYFHRMPSQQSIIEWYSSTGLKPYLDLLGDNQKQELKEDTLEKVKMYYPVQNNGEVIFKFDRLFFVAKK